MWSINAPAAFRPLVLTMGCSTVLGCAGPGGPTFTVTFPADRSSEPLDGRLVLMLSQDDAAEPRFQIVDGPNTQLAFGVDVEGWAPGEAVTVDGGAFGYPIRSLNDIPAGEYRVQALLNRYQTYERADGHVVKLPPDQGEGQVWNRKPGNPLLHPARRSRSDRAERPRIAVVLDQEIPPAPDAAGVGVREARQDPERPPHRVLGHAHRPRGLGPHPARLRRASRRRATRSPSTTATSPTPSAAGGKSPRTPT